MGRSAQGPGKIQGLESPCEPLCGPGSRKTFTGRPLRFSGKREKQRQGQRQKQEVVISDDEIFAESSTVSKGDGAVGETQLRVADTIPELAQTSDDMDLIAAEIQKLDH